MQVVHPGWSPVVQILKMVLSELSWMAPLSPRSTARFDCTGYITGLPLLKPQFQKEYFGATIDHCFTPVFSIISLVHFSKAERSTLGSTCLCNICGNLEERSVGFEVPPLVTGSWGKAKVRY